MLMKSANQAFKMYVLKRSSGFVQENYPLYENKQHLKQQEG